MQEEKAMPRKANTRAASGAGSIRQRPDGRWEARVTVGNDPGTGKPIRRSIYGNTQKEVLTAMRDAQKAIDDGLYIEPTRLTLAQWLDIWQSDYLLSQKYGTVKTYKAQIATHIKPALGAVKLTKLTPHIIQGFYNDLLANGRIVPKRDKQGKIIKKDGVAVTETAPLNAKTVRNVHGVLTKALSQAVKVGYIARNPCDMVDLPRVEKAQIMPLTDEQVKSYLAAADTDNDYGDILKVILFTGLREAEALGLTWDCVDISPESIAAGRASLYIDKELQRVNVSALDTLDDIEVIRRFPSRTSLCTTVQILKKPKTESSVRTVFLPRTVAEMLVAYKADQDNIKEALGDEYTDYNLVVAGPLGLPTEHTTVNAALNRLIKKNNLPKVVFHSFRHSSITYKLKLNGGDIKAVQGDSGHAQASMVTEQYAHILDDDRRINAQKFDDMFYKHRGAEPEIQHTNDEPNAECGTGAVDAEAAAALTKLLSDPSMAALIKNLAKSL